MRRPMTLEKKEARRGLRGHSISRKAYSWFRRSGLSAKESLIMLTSDVSNSQAIFGYL